MSKAMERVKRLSEKFLGQQLYVIHTVPKASREELDRILPEHLEHQIRLKNSGIMFAAGPMMNADGTPAGGLDRRIRNGNTRATFLS